MWDLWSLYTNRVAYYVIDSSLHRVPPDMAVLSLALYIHRDFPREKQPRVSPLY